MLPKTTAQIEVRANILNPRIKNLIELYHNTRSQLSKIRIQRLISSCEKELCRLETEYRRAKYREFTMAKWLKEIPDCRLN